MDSVADAEADDNRIRCGSGCCKSVLVLINLIFMVIGLALVGVIIWIHFYRETFVYYRLLEDSPSTLPPSFYLSHPPQHHHHQQQQQQHIPTSVTDRTIVIMFITIVALIVTFGFLGCCGASVESICFLCLCVILTVSVVIAEIVIASMLPGIKEKVYGDLLRRMDYQIRFQYNRTSPKVEQQVIADLQLLTLAWDTLQIRFNCCGASGPRDFMYSAWYNQTDDKYGLFVPVTCCLLVDPNPHKPIARDDSLCQVEALVVGHKPLGSFKEIQEVGCHKASTTYVDYYCRHPLIIFAYCILILLQLVDAVFCCFLILWIRRKLLEIDATDNEDSDEDDGCEED